MKYIIEADRQNLFVHNVNCSSWIVWGIYTTHDCVTAIRVMNKRHFGRFGVRIRYGGRFFYYSSSQADVVLLRDYSAIIHRRIYSAISYRMFWRCETETITIGDKRNRKTLFISLDTVKDLKWVRKYAGNFSCWHILLSLKSNQM